MQKQILTPINSSNYVANFREKNKRFFIIQMLILPMIMCIHTLFKFCPFSLKKLSKKQILKSIKGSFYVTNLQKMTFYNPITGRVNDIVYTRFGLNLSISSQDMEQKPNSDANQWRLLCCEFAVHDASQLRSC